MLLRLIFFLYLCLGLLLSPSYAEDVLDFEKKADTTPIITLKQDLQILEDKTGKLTIEEVASPKYREKFKAIRGRNKNLGFTQSVIWVHITLHNKTDNKTWYLSTLGPLYQYQQVYLSQSLSLPSPQSEIQALPRSRAPSYLLNLEKDKSYDLYLRMKNKAAPLKLAFKIYTPEQRINNISLNDPFYAFILGGLLALALYYFLFFIYLKESSFLSLSIFIIASTLEISNHTGVLNYFNFFTLYLKDISAMFGFTALASGFLFATFLFNFKENLPSSYPFFKAIFWILCLFIPIAPWLPYSMLVIAISISIVALVIFTALFILFLRGHRFPSSLIAGLVILLLGTMPSILYILGLVDANQPLAEYIYIAMLISLILFSITQTEKHRLLREDAERVASSNKAKDEFLTTMSHELRTPMNAVVGVGSLLRLTSLDEKQRAYVDRLEISSHHMLDLINDILDLARFETTQTVLEAIPFKLNDKIDEVRHLLEEQAISKGLKFDIKNKADDNLYLVGDPTRLKQVLINLLGNAIKFTEQGQVSLSIKKRPLGTHKISLQFEINDTGLGITEEQQKHLFKPFSQAESSTNRQYGGSGLGLSISKQLVNCMGGELLLESKINKGSRIFFTLIYPIHKKKQEYGVSLTNKKISTLQGVKLLLVDDDELNQFIGRELLQTLGLQVDVASSGKDSIKQVEEKTFDVILMDISMPGMDGYETTRQLRQGKSANRKLPIIALTAHSIAGERARCLQAGMNDYVTKPFELEDLKAVIQQNLLNAQKNI